MEEPVQVNPEAEEQNKKKVEAVNEKETKNNNNKKKKKKQSVAEIEPPKAAPKDKSNKEEEEATPKVPSPIDASNDLTIDLTRKEGDRVSPKEFAVRTHESSYLRLLVDCVVDYYRSRRGFVSSL